MSDMTSRYLPQRMRLLGDLFDSVRFNSNPPLVRHLKRSVVPFTLAHKRKENRLLVVTTWKPKLEKKEHIELMATKKGGKKAAKRVAPDFAKCVVIESAVKQKYKPERWREPTRISFPKH